MRILHTSDWHIGRTFHGHSTLAHLEQVLGAIVEATRANSVDVVVIAGDVFDTATPSGDALKLFSRTLGELRAAGALVVVTSGNHDSPARLGFQSEFAAAAGIHVITDAGALDRPVVIDDEHGPVRLYGIPYLAPSLVQHRWPEATLKTQEQVIGFALDRIRDDLAVHPARSVVIAHCFAAGVAPSGDDVEREIRVGTLDVVPTSAFDGIDYTALGHIHGRSTLAEGIRYSGAPLHYSFSEAGKPRGAWLVELDASGLASVDWLELPVPRRLSVLTGTLAELLADPALDERTLDWVHAVLTDNTRPIDAMRKLQTRFPFCANLDYQPAEVAETVGASYAERVKAKSDDEVIGAFLSHVRNGDGPSAAESELIAAVIADLAAEEVSA
ncbi:exonuclease SbcCD subunit D [Agromyces seonyuensis]|uniref:Nuclease SbcCD subunit D n=1 Tax=Agromyces seonyuensis TaxID=2662446 RepID=A0A6I4P1C4_9MICO|nr:exonuclease SbcCD subunit D [Agromyces seonyuensis]MWB99332.1 exonuclease subunit SbcD [Agromyces seonyuensis]